MAGVVDVAHWMREQRRKLGWTAAQLADRANQLAALQSVELNLKQQSISAFEVGTAKRIPQWFRYVESAINEGLGQNQLRLQAQPNMLMMPVALPSEGDLENMFEALLRVPGAGETDAERAQFLARQLPVALAQLLARSPSENQDALVVSEQASVLPANGRSARSKEPNT